MTKSFYAISLFSVLFMAGCSSNDDNLISPSYEAGDSDVKIVLGTKIANASITKASINNNEDGSWTASNLGIFALAKGIQTNSDGAPTVAGAYEVDWSQAQWSNCIMNNVQANVENDTISWKNGGTYYYPISNWYNYNFYGYYPRQNTTLITSSTVSAQLTIDGSVDVIWGKATSDETYAYSAKYFRANSSTNAAEMTFKHLLSRLTFSVIAGADKNGSTEKAKTIKVKNITVLNQPDRISLAVANRLEPNQEGKIDTLSVYHRSDFILKEANNGSLQTVQVSDQNTPVGESIMIYPQNNGLRLRIILADAAGTEFQSEPIILTTNGFESGTSYNILITVHAPTEIELTSKLIPWAIGSETNVEL